MSLYSKLKFYFVLFLILRLCNSNNSRSKTVERPQDLYQRRPSKKVASNCSKETTTGITLSPVNQIKSEKKLVRKFLVSLKTPKDLYEGSFGELCVGAIVSQIAILSAAHCLIRTNGQKKRPKWIKAVEGNMAKSRKPSTSRVFTGEEIILYGWFNYDSLEHDLGVVKFTPETNLYENQHLYALLTTQKPETGWNCTVYGWSRLFMQKSLMEDLISMDVLIVDNELCGLRNETNGGIWICTSLLGRNEAEIFLVDSGGPLICNGELAGIASHSDFTQNITYFTNIHHYRNWILENNSYLRAPHMFTLLLGLIVSSL